VAQESDEADWPIEATEMIGQARLDLATSRPDNLSQSLKVGRRRIIGRQHIDDFLAGC
jgi:hypothetical protein